MPFFQPLLNPIGFGASDFIELGLAVFLVALVLVRPWAGPAACRFAEKTGWCMLLLAVLPVALRLALLPHHPAPEPQIYDEFSHLLVADTLRHFWLANPAHQLNQFFETFFVLQEPTYSSIYSIGQGLALAIGWTLFGHPWAGVILPMAAFCSLSYWMLRAWTTPGWALMGGLLAVCEFGPLNLWTNCYWGGGLAASAGCLVFGALPRLRKRGRVRDGALLGLGLGIHLLTRQYESIFLVLSVALFFAPLLRSREKIRGQWRPAAATALVALCALGATLVQNKQVTGSWTTLPEALSQYQYGVPASLTFQPIPVPHRELTPQQQLDYKMQVSFRQNATETLETYLLRLEYRVRHYRFFFYAPLYLALFAFVVTVREFRFVWVLVTPLLFALGVNFFPAFQFHYVAACSCLFLLMSVGGLRQLSRLRILRLPAGRETAQLLVALCAAQFLFWYTMHVFDGREFSAAMRNYETWDAINHDIPNPRALVRKRLTQIPGKQLVFVHYWPGHIFQNEWVYNAADIDGAKIVWARDLGPEENEKLQHYFPDRKAWLLEPDARPPRLSAYEPPPEKPVQPAKPSNKMELEQVH